MRSSRLGPLISRVVVYTHRWLGIVLGALFVGWFVSGVVLMYAGMPRLSPAERLAGRPLLDFSRATVAPAALSDMLGGAPDTVQLSMVLGRPVYRGGTKGRVSSVFADNGRPVAPFSADDALDEARAFPAGDASRIRYDGLVSTPDQWTLESSRQLPMHRIALGDVDDTRLYVSAASGDIVLKTTASTRRWAYPGAILHWIYLTPIRRHPEAWAQLIISTSVLGTLMCVVGLAWGAWRYSPMGAFRLQRQQSHSPYAGWMWWHHYAGLVFGVVTITWIFSGLLSMDPWDWHPSTVPTIDQRLAFAGGQPTLSALTLDDLVRAISGVSGAREATVIQSQGRLWLASDRGVVALRGGPGMLPLNTTSVLPIAARANPTASVTAIAMLDQYDSYYYDRDGQLPLPVMRVEYDDPQRTWLYVDPQRGVLVRKEERLTRLNRWLYHGLHSLDFPVLYYRRPLWDVVVIVLSAGGLLLTVTTIGPAWRRLRRHGRRLRPSLSSASRVEESGLPQEPRTDPPDADPASSLAGIK